MIRRGKRVIEERPLSATGYKFIEIRSVPLRRAWPELRVYVPVIIEKVTMVYNQGTEAEAD